MGLSTSQIDSNIDHLVLNPVNRGFETFVGRDNPTFVNDNFFPGPLEDYTECNCSRELIDKQFKITLT